VASVRVVDVTWPEHVVGPRNTWLERVLGGDVVCLLRLSDGGKLRFNGYTEDASALAGAIRAAVDEGELPRPTQGPPEIYRGRRTGATGAGGCVRTDTNDSPGGSATAPKRKPKAATTPDSVSEYSDPDEHTATTLSISGAVRTITKSGVPSDLPHQYSISEPGRSFGPLKPERASAEPNRRSITVEKVPSGPSPASTSQDRPLSSRPLNTSTKSLSQLLMSLMVSLLARAGKAT
jgi:hypothetical protein